MDDPTLSTKKLICKYCNKIEFSNKFNLFRHMKNIHNEEVIVQSTKKNHIFCIICSDEKVKEGFTSYEEYTRHLQDAHDIQVEEKSLNFDNRDDFEAWRSSEKRDVDYAKQNNSAGKTFSKIYYNCNRSDSRGYVSNRSKKVMKAGGSIKIKGTCPSRIIATFLAEGPVIVRYIHTHVGHEAEVRAQRLSKNEQKYLLDQFRAGVSPDRIIKNARGVQKTDEPSRLNIVSKNDLYNLVKRKNIENMRQHKKAVLMKNCLQEKGFGQFSIESSTNDKYYTVSYEESCTSANCRKMFCTACEMCLHKYKCECDEYLMKSILCKHVHVVAMYERERLKSLLANEINSPNTCSQKPDDEETYEIVIEENDTSDSEENDDEKNRKELVMEQASDYIKQMFSLDDDAFQVFEKNFEQFMSKNNEDLNMIGSKRKIEKYSQEKRKRNR